MPFGVVNRSWPNPVDNTDLGRGMTWMGYGLGVHDGKNNRLQVYAVGSGLTELWRQALPAGVASPIGPRVFGRSLLGRGGAGLVQLLDFPTLTPRSIFVHASAEVFGVDYDGNHLVTLTTCATLNRWESTGAAWTLAQSVPAPNPYPPFFAGLVVQGMYAYTTTSGGVLVKSDLSRWTVVATAPAPATGPNLGMCSNGHMLFVGVAGGTDRIYEVTLG